jgi:hypothetical protein
VEKLKIRKFGNWRLGAALLEFKLACLLIFCEKYGAKLKTCGGNRRQQSS